MGAVIGDAWWLVGVMGGGAVADGVAQVADG